LNLSRIKKRIHLTEAGRFFLDRARQLICDAETSAQQVREQFGDGKKTIRLGFLSVFLDDIVAPATRKLRKEYPRTDVALFELSPKAQLDRLRDNELDLALLGNLNNEDRMRFVVTTLARSPMAVVLPSDHALANRKQLTLKELAEDPFVSLSDSIFPGRRQFLRTICREQGFDPVIAQESDSIPLLLVTVASGEGVALLPSHSSKLPHSGCVFVRLKSPLVYAEVMAVSQKEASRGALSALIQQMESAAKEVVG
jgi:DNA-binding transcriptional LysR family regulator